MNLKALTPLGLDTNKIFVNDGNYHETLELSQSNRNGPEVQGNLKLLNTHYT
jgi:hypothetical protein